MDAVVNHMSGLGRVGTADGGSTYNGDALDFPGVPFSAEHFTPRDQCPSGDGIIYIIIIRPLLNLEHLIISISAFHFWP